MEHVAIDLGGRESRICVRASDGGIDAELAAAPSCVSEARLLGYGPLRGACLLGWDGARRVLGQGGGP